MQNLSWQYPSWYLILCLFLGVGASIFLYYKDKTFSDQPAWLRYLMAIIRGLVVTVLSSLLLAPLLKLLQNRTEPPVIILAQDQSASIRSAFSKADSSTYMKSLDDLYNNLSTKYVVHRLGFGQEVKELETGATWKMKDQASDLGELMTYVDEQYKGQNVGAIIVASDGAINRGKNPLYIPLSQKAPLYTVALGDTIRKTDLQVKDVFHNSIVYLGDKFSLQVDLSAVRLKGANTSLEIKQILDSGDILLEKTPITIDADPWFTTRDVIIEAKQSGVQRYRVQVSQVKNEVTYVNNVRDFFVEVIDGRLNVLLLANSPHPDLAVWRSALLSQRNYEVDIRMAYEMTLEQLKKYDLVILHQLPSVKNPVQNILNELDKKGTPRIFVAGYQTDLNALNQAQPFLNILAAGNRTPNDVTMVLNPSFNLFNLTDEVKAKLPAFSPLLSPYGEYTATPSAQVMSYQRIGSVDTQYPLIIMGEANDKRTCIIAGEGIWKWQLYDQLQNGSKEITYEILNQISQYTSTKSDKRKFKVTSSKRLFTELEEISFQAELYNDSYELINTPEVSIRIRNKEGEDFDYTFNTSGQSYALQIGRFPEGSYSWTASTDVNGVKLTHDGKFVVQPIQLETLETTADHGLLRQLASMHGGSLVYANQISQLSDLVLEDEHIKPILYSSTQTRPLIHLKWLCVILLVALSLEWFLRRYYGGY
ncbi:MAG TPA: hypothetical protein VFG10_20950 [Saprospiraceae bacterium]|nr:hypothetical protein [Saprospiraceae bacterium]